MRPQTLSVDYIPPGTRSAIRESTRLRIPKLAIRYSFLAAPVGNFSLFVLTAMVAVLLSAEHGDSGAPPLIALGEVILFLNPIGKLVRLR